MSTTAVAPRPTSVTTAIVLGWISVVVDVAMGISLIALATNDSVLSSLDLETSTARTYGIVALVFAVILAAVVYLLGKGSNIARMLVTIVMVLRIAFGVWALIALGSHQMAEAIVAIVIAVVVLALLWNAKASQFFATNNP